MSISFVGVTSAQGAGTGTTTRFLSPIVPTLAGDLLVAFIANNAPGAETNPLGAPDVGWTRIRRDLSITGGTSAQLWYKIATGASDGGGTWTFGAPSSADVVVMDVLAYRTTEQPWALGNHDVLRTQQFVANSPNTENVVAPSVLADTRATQLLMCNFVSDDEGGGVGQSGTFALPGSLAQRYNTFTNHVSESNGEDVTVAPSAASGARTAVFSLIGPGRTTDQIGQSVIFGTDTAVIPPPPPPVGVPGYARVGLP